MSKRIRKKLWVNPYKYAASKAFVLMAHDVWNVNGLIFGGGRKLELIGADLMKADLSHSNLMEANLKGVTLTNADLSNADLTGVKLFGAAAYGRPVKLVYTDHEGGDVE
jgi:hypothetical protein